MTSHQPQQKSLKYSMSVSAALLAFSVVSPVFGSGCGGDYNRDGEVGSADLGSMLSAWGTSEIGYDLDGDGVVNAGDLGLLIAAWGPCQTEERCHTGSAVLMGTGSGGEVGEHDGGVFQYPDAEVVFDADACSAEEGMRLNSMMIDDPAVVYLPYEVEGNDILEVYEAIMTKDGVIGTDGHRYTGYTRFNLTVQAGCTDYYASNVTHFGIADVRISYVIEYPVWTNRPSDLPAEQAKAWDGMMLRLMEHELMHVTIGHSYAFNLLMEAVGGIDGGGFTRNVEGSACPAYFGDVMVPGTGNEISTFEKEAIQWLYAGHTWTTMMAAQGHFDNHSGHGSIWDDLSP